MKKQATGGTRLRLFWEFHKVKIIIGLVFLGSIVWPMIVVGRLESYNKILMMASLSLLPIQSIVSGATFVFMYWWLLYGGMQSLSPLKLFRHKFPH